MCKKRDPYGVTPAYLAWKRKGSPGVFDLEKDRQVPVEEDPVLSAEEEAELPKQFKLRDPEEDILELVPIGLSGNEADVIITCEEDAVKCQHAVFWPGCAACEYSGPKGLQ
jgi:hypothetical protein